MSVVQSMGGKDLVYYKLHDAPPPRICYELVNRNPHFSRVETINEFDKELDKFINENNMICKFKEWMLKQEN